MKYKHNKKFYTSRYKEFINKIEKQGYKNPFHNKDEFISEWLYLKEEGVKNVMGRLVYDTKYQTNYKTALAEYRISKDLGLKLSLKEVKEMTTTQFAELHKDNINKMYDYLINSGMTGEQAGNYIGQYWFGSE